VTSVVIPVYRNVDTLGTLHDRLHVILEGAGEPYEVVFVDDASPDGSQAMLLVLARTDPHVRVHRLPVNVGQQRAVLAGLAQARGVRVVVMDADLQDPPEAIPVLIGALNGNVSAVFLGRRGRHQPIVRHLTSRLFKMLLHRLCGTPPDAGLFVAMDRRMVTRLLAFGRPGPSVLAMIGCTGLPLVSVPLSRASRSQGRSGYSAWRRVSMGVRVLAWVLAWKWYSPSAR